MQDRPPNIHDRFRAWLEEIIMTRMVQQHSPGPLFRWIFKIPILFYKLGLGNFVGNNILLLTTTGRKTGKIRHTPLEFTYEPETNTYILMAGWGGKTDWYRNLLANPDSLIQIGRKTYPVTAEPIPRREVAELMMEVVRRVPRMQSVWQRWSDQPIDGTLNSYIHAAKFFPSMRLHLRNP